jgi:hypothetical protein
LTSEGKGSAAAAALTSEGKQEDGKDGKEEGKEEGGGKGQQQAADPEDDTPAQMDTLGDHEKAALRRLQSLVKFMDSGMRASINLSVYIVCRCLVQTHNHAHRYRHNTTPTPTPPFQPPTPTPTEGPRGQLIIIIIKDT